MVVFIKQQAHHARHYAGEDYFDYVLLHDSCDYHQHNWHKTERL